MIRWILNWISGDLIGQLAKPFKDAYVAKLNAETEEDKLAADIAVRQVEARMQIAIAESTDFWSATRLGRLLIVVPYGVWWALVFLDSSLGNVAWLDPKALPPNIKEMANVLVPAIVIADAGSIGMKRFFGGRQ